MAYITHLEIRGSSTVNIYNDKDPVTSFSYGGGVAFYTGVVYYDDGTTELVSDPDYFSFTNPSADIEIDGPFRNTIQLTLRGGEAYKTLLLFKYKEFQAGIPIWRDYTAGMEVTPLEITFQSDYNLTQNAQMWLLGFTSYGLTTINTPDWITASRTDGNISLTASINTNKGVRTGTVSILYQGVYNDQPYLLTKTISVSQLGAFDYAPIWKDLGVYELPNDVSYTITDPNNGDIIYNGRAVGYDGTTIYLNKIIAGLLPKNEFPNETGEFDYSKKIIYKTYNNNLSYEFVNNRSYDTEELGDKGSYLLSKPVTNRLFRGSKFIVSFKDRVDITIGNGTTTYDSNNYSNVVIDLDYMNCTTLSVYSPGENRRIDYSISDPRDNYYILYYVNKYGGWDQLCLEGNVTQVDNINRYSYRQWNPWTSSTNLPYGNRTYLTEYTPQWQLNTGFIFGKPIDMSDLFESNNLMLYDGKRYIPVVVTDTSVTHKTYRNNGNKTYNYVINVSQSMPQINE